MYEIITGRVWRLSIVYYNRAGRELAYRVADREEWKLSSTCWKDDVWVARNIDVECECSSGKTVTNIGLWKTRRSAERSSVTTSWQDLAMTWTHSIGDRRDQATANQGNCCLGDISKSGYWNLPDGRGWPATVASSRMSNHRYTHEHTTFTPAPTTQTSIPWQVTNYPFKPFNTKNELNVKM